MPYKDKDKKNQYQLAWMKKRRKEWFDINSPCVKMWFLEKIRIGSY